MKRQDPGRSMEQVLDLAAFTGPQEGGGRRSSEMFWTSKVIVGTA